MGFEVLFFEGISLCWKILGVFLAKIALSTD